MRRSLVILFVALCAMYGVPDANGGVGGAVDKRHVVGWLPGNEPWYCIDDKTGKSKCTNKWNTAPYWNYVYVYNRSGWSGTGEFISPKHILTNKHVADGCGLNNKPKCAIYISDGRSFNASVVKYENNPDFKSDERESDWSILEIEGYASKHWFDYTSPTPEGAGAWRAGFGALNVLSADDIKNIRTAYKKWLHIVHPYNFLWQGVKQDMRQIDLNYNDNDINDNQDYYKTFITTFKELTNKDFVEDYLSDDYTLKAIEYCHIGAKYSKMATHSCQSWAGDSGSSLQNNSNQIMLLTSRGYRYVTSEKEYTNSGIVTENIFSEEIEEMLNAAKNKK